MATFGVQPPAALSSLWTEGYLVVPNLLTPSSVERLGAHVLGLAEAGFSSDSQVPGAPARHGDSVMDRLLEVMLPIVERLAARPLFPTYSYWRIYRTGDSLARHTDRAACEVSVSVSLECRGVTFWPLWVEGLGRTASAELTPGDGLIYLGMRCPHWREPFTGTEAVQVFLHYVAQDGPFRGWKFDKRPALSHRDG